MAEVKMSEVKVSVYKGQVETKNSCLWIPGCQLQMQNHASVVIKYTCTL